MGERGCFWGYSWMTTDRYGRSIREQRIVELDEGRYPTNAKGVFHADVIVGPFENRYTALKELGRGIVALESALCAQCNQPLEQYSGTTDHRFPYLCRGCAEEAIAESGRGSGV